MERQQVIDARLARFIVTRDARDVWPEVSVASFRAAQHEVARVATAVLTDAPRPVAFNGSSRMDAQALAVAAFATGMGPLVGYWCETGTVAAHGEIAQRLATALAHGRRRAADLRRALQAILGQLAHGQVDAWVLRGTHTRERYLPDPGTGSTSHIDLLIRRDDWEAASTAMRAIGFVIAAGATASDRQDWTSPGSRITRSLEFAHVEDSWFVTLHLNSVLGAPDAVLSEVWHEFSRPVRVLPPSVLLADLAVDASNHFYELSLIRLVEVAFVARRDFAGRPEAWSEFIDLVARRAVGSRVFPALDLVERLAPGTIDPLVREHVAASAPWRLRRVVGAATPASVLRVHPLPRAGRSVWAAGPLEVAMAVATAWSRRIRTTITSGIARAGSR